MTDTIGIRAKNIREELRLSQEEFGAKIGLSKQGVSNIEKDRSFMSAQVLSKLVIDLNVNLNYLIVGIGSMFLQTEKTEKDYPEDIIKRLDAIEKKVGIR